jgi:copper chaperone CopZ
MLKGLDGVVSASVSLLTHKSQISYQPHIIGIRTLIEKVEEIGFSAKFEQKSDKSDIRFIV